MRYMMPYFTRYWNTIDYCNDKDKVSQGTTLKSAVMLPHPASQTVAVGVSQHGEIIEQPQCGSALAELSGEQQETFPQLLRRSVCFTFQGEKPSNQLRAETGRPDLDRRRIYQLIIVISVTVIPTITNNYNTLYYNALL